MPALDGVRSDGLNLPYSLEAEQAVLGSMPALTRWRTFCARRIFTFPSIRPCTG